MIIFNVPFNKLTSLLNKSIYPLLIKIYKQNSSFFLFFPVCWGANGIYAQKLLNDLFRNYTSALRPVEDTEDILNVTLQITLSQIIDMVICHRIHRTTAYQKMSSNKDTRENVVILLDNKHR